MVVKTSLLEEGKALVAATGIRHVALIMDGNRRWATQRHLPKLAGHAQGVEALKATVRFAQHIGLEALTVYAFSTENWKRGEEEVGYLLKLFIQALARELDTLHAEGARIRFIGDLAPLPRELRNALEAAMAKTAENPGIAFQVATNYGARAELVQAAQTLARRIQAGELALEDVTEATFGHFLYTAALPELDLLIRTGGESRLSNFLLWQAAYAELYITDTLWPDFGESALVEALQAFAQRERRYGR